MKLDKEFLQKLLKPFAGVVSLKPSEYINQLINSGVSVENELDVIDEKFHRHFEHLIEQGLITNSSGVPTLEKCGIRLSSNKHIILGDSTLLKSHKASNPVKNDTVTNYNFNAEFSGNLQSGQNNTINTTTIQNLIDSLEKSDDPQAKKLLDSVWGIVGHPLVQGILSCV